MGSKDLPMERAFRPVLNIEKESAGEELGTRYSRQRE